MSTQVPEQNSGRPLVVAQVPRCQVPCPAVSVLLPTHGVQLWAAGRPKHRQECRCGRRGRPRHHPRVPSPAAKNPETVPIRSIPSHPACHRPRGVACRQFGDWPPGPVLTKGLCQHWSLPSTRRQFDQVSHDGFHLAGWKVVGRHGARRFKLLRVARADVARASGGQDRRPRRSTLVRGAGLWE